jgi:multiple sugar transport system substrate-binding protein
MTPEKLSAAVQLIKSGNKQAAIPLLREIIQDNPVDENAWLWLYACVDQVEQKKFCLQKVLEINPGNQGARKALGKLSDPLSQPVWQMASRKATAPPPASRRRASRRKRSSRRPWVFALGAVLLCILCIVPSLYLTQTDQVSSFAAGLALFPSVTFTPTPSPSATITATVTPSPSPTSTATATPTLTPTPSEVVEITWFSGFGAGSGVNGGTDRDGVAVLQSMAEDFNASQGSIHLNLEVVHFASGAKKLISEIAAGKGPDIVGPMVLNQTHDFHGQWLDLTPYIRPADLQAYNPKLMEIYHTDEGLVALPSTAYPSALFYNKELFDAANLNYPPAQYGEKYKMPDGSEVEWSWDTLATVARLLTLDARGVNATQPGFDKQNIIHYGYSWMFQLHPSQIGSYWGSGSMLAEDGKTAHIPEAWHAAWEWTYDGTWGNQPFIIDINAAKSTQFNNLYSFDKGRIGMTIQPTWYICCTQGIKTWDLAAMPSYNGQVSGRIDVTDFRILKGSKHPQEAYQAMLYMLNQGGPKLMNISAPISISMSARDDQRQTWINAQKREFPWVTNWDVLIAGLDYPDLPKAESYMPNFKQAWERGSNFYVRLMNQPNLGLAAEEQKYIDDLNKIFAGGE